MKRAVSALQVVRVEMGINLRCRNIGVPRTDGEVETEEVLAAMDERQLWRYQPSDEVALGTLRTLIIVPP